MLAIWRQLLLEFLSISVVTGFVWFFLLFGLFNIFISDGPGHFLPEGEASKPNRLSCSSGAWSGSVVQGARILALKTMNKQVATEWGPSGMFLVKK